jgi:serine/threonine protein kinase
MGEVYRARCRPDGKVVAIKIEGSKASQDPRARFRERFLREARILRELRHENLPQFYAVGEVPDGRVFIAMELLIGRTLSEFVGQDLDTLIPIFLQCARSLKVTSEAGVVHRDVSPDNFFVVEVGGRSVVKLIDFGISRDAAAIADGLTRAGTFLGKLKYCSPEQTGLLREMGPVDWRTDLFSFALTMYAVLLHRLPFRGATSQEQFQERTAELRAEVFDAVPSERLRRLLAKMLRRSPDDRPGSFDEVVAELLRVKAELAEEQANRLDASTRLRGRAAPSPEASAPPPAPPAKIRVTPVQVQPAPAPKARPHLGSFVSTEGLALVAGLLIVGSLSLFLVQPGEMLGSAAAIPGARGPSSFLFPVSLLLGVGLAALAVVRVRARRILKTRLDGRRGAVESAVLAAAAAAEFGESGIEMAARPSGAHLVVAGDGPTRDIWLCGDRDGSWPAEILIGRGVAEGPAAVRVASQAVSSLQARLRHLGGTFSVENLSKTNTTRVNGRELSPGEKRLLTVGDRIEMGPVTVSFHVR